MHKHFLLLALLGLTAVCNLSAQLMSVADVMALPARAPDASLHYGPDSLQYGDLRLPDGKGPHPVVVIIHGGCWLAAYDLHLMDAMATTFAEEGYATWNLEYRRVGDKGGGWPSTFLDVANGLNHLRQLAPEYDLDLNHIVVVGHSAGGHLALWLAGQYQLPASSPVAVPDVLPLSGVVSLAGITDPVTYLVRDKQACGANVDELLGGLPEDIPERYRQASPLVLAPIGVRQVLISGSEDKIVPLPHLGPYVIKATYEGDPLRLVTIPGAGHFEVIAPGSNAWPEVVKAVRKLGRKKARRR